MDIDNILIHGVSLEAYGYRDTIVSNNDLNELLSKDEALVLTRNSITAYLQANHNTRAIEASAFLLYRGLEKRLANPHALTNSGNTLTIAGLALHRVLIAYAYIILALSAHPENISPKLLSMLLSLLAQTAAVDFSEPRRPRGGKKKQSLGQRPEPGKPGEAETEVKGTASSTAVIASLLASTIINALEMHKAPYTLKKGVLEGIVMASTVGSNQIDTSVSRTCSRVLESLADCADPSIVRALARCLGERFAAITSKVDTGVVTRLVEGNAASVMSSKDKKLMCTILTAVLALRGSFSKQPQLLELAQLTLSRCIELIGKQYVFESPIAPHLHEGLIALSSNLLDCFGPAMQSLRDFRLRCFLLLTSLAAVASRVSQKSLDSVVKGALDVLAATSEGAYEEDLVALCSFCRTLGCVEDKRLMIALGAKIHSLYGKPCLGYVELLASYFGALGRCVLKVKGDAGARKSASTFELIEEDRTLVQTELNEVIQFFLQTSRDLTCEAMTQQKDDEEDENKEKLEGAVGKFISCLGSQRVFTMVKLCPHEAPLNRMFFINSNMWLIDALQQTEGYLDIRTYFTEFAPLVNLVRQRVGQNYKDGEPEFALLTAVVDELINSVVFLSKDCVDMDFLIRDKLKDLFDANYSVNEVPAVAKLFGRVIKYIQEKSTVEMGAETPKSTPSITQETVHEIWKLTFNWATNALRTGASIPSVGEAGRDLLCVLACSVPQAGVVNLISHFLMKGVEQSSDVYIELAAYAMEKAAEYRTLTESMTQLMGVCMPRLGTLKSMDVPLARAWMHLIRRFLDFFSRDLDAMAGSVFSLMMSKAGSGKVPECTLNVMAQWLLHFKNSGQNTPVPVIKNRMQCHESTLNFINSLLPHVDRSRKHTRMCI